MSHVLLSTRQKEKYKDNMVTTIVNSILPLSYSERIIMGRWDGVVQYLKRSGASLFY